MGASFRMLLVVPVFLGLVSLAPVTATAGGTSVSIGGGWLMPAGDFSDVAKSGWQVFGGFDVPLASRFSLGFDGAYSPLKTTDAFLTANGAEPGTLDEGKVTLWRGGAHGDYLLGQGQTIPFLRAGVGAYGVKTKVTTLFFGDHEASDVKAGVSLGAGLLFKPEFGGSFELGAAYHRVSGGGVSFSELRIAWRWGGGE